MKKIIIYGTGSLADEFLACINSKNFEIIGFIDLYKDEFKDYKKINLKSLDEFVFDYLICATSFVDDFNQILEIKNINQNKIIYLHPYLTIYNQELDLKRKISKLRNTNISNLVLGLSYARDGLRDEFLSNHTVNLSLGSQDLISDFKLLNYLKEQNILNNINHLILGVGYYAFEHELNKMFFSKYELRYSDLFDIEQDLEYYKFLKKHCFKYLDEELLNIIEAYKFEKIRTNPDKSNFIKNAMEMSEKHNRMSYPKSRIKNELSFLKIIDICKEFNIKLTVINFNHTKLYMENLNKDVVSKFKSDILNVLNSLNNSMYIDLNKELSLDDYYFYDATHLNIIGSMKTINFLKEKGIFL